MPVVEFALDPRAQHRIQVHLPAEQPASVTILLNRSILGSLTSDEQSVGKNFLLPDNSVLNVRIVNGQPQVSRAGYPLPLIDANAANEIDSSPAALAQERNKKLGGFLIAWLVLNLVVIGCLTMLHFLASLGAIALGVSPLEYLLFSLLGVVGMLGISLIFFWKKMGFYLAAAYVILGVSLSIPLGLLIAPSFIPLVSVAILYVHLNRSGIWEKMS